MKSEFALQSAVVNTIQMCLMTHPIFKTKGKDIQPQDQFNVVLGLQYAALANSVKGLNAATCEGVRGVMPPFGGAALTIEEANKEMKIKPPASIVFLLLEAMWVPRISNVENRGYGKIVIYTWFRKFFVTALILRQQNADSLENKCHPPGSIGILERSV